METDLSIDELKKLRDHYIHMEEEEPKQDKIFIILFYIAYFLVCLSFVTGIIKNSFSITMIFLSWSLAVYHKAVYDQRRKENRELCRSIIAELDKLIESSIRRNYG